MTYVKKHARKRPGSLVLMIALAGVIAYLLSTAFAGPGVAGSAKATGAASYVNVGADEFQPDSSCTGGTDFDYSGYSGALDDYGNGCTYEAPVSLPAKSKISSVTVFYAPNGGTAHFHLEANDDFGDHIDLLEEGIPDCGDTYCAATFALDGTAVTDPVNRHYGIYLPVNDNGDDWTLYRFRINLKGSAAGGGIASFSKGTNGTHH